MSSIKSIKYLLLTFIVVVIASCRKDSLNGRLDGLESRIKELEETISKINDNTLAVNALYRKNILITSFKLNENGYDLSLSSGEVLHITYGDKIDGLAPIVGIDEDGEWAISNDGGKSFTKIPDAALPGSKNGSTPLVRVDKYGFWNISLDGGNNWERILDGNGNPMSAKDGKSMIESSYSFFKNVVYNEKTSALDITMTDGHTLSIPVKKEAVISTRYMDGTVYAFAGKEVLFPVDIEGVDNAVWTNVPDGWKARLDDEYISITAPENGERGEYNLQLLAIGYNGDAKTYNYKFNYDPNILFHDDFDGKEIDERYWKIWKGGDYRSDWDRYAEGDAEHSFLKDGNLRLLGSKYENTYRTGAVCTRENMNYAPPFRIDCRARFTEMAYGVWFAIWTSPVAGYQYGEIDIMEKANYGTKTQHSTHTNYTLRTDPNKQDQKNSGYGDCLPGVYNTYSVELREDGVFYYINNIEVFRYAHIVHSLDDPAYQKLNEIEKPYYLLNYTHMEQTYQFLLDIAIGGAYPGVQVVDEELPGIFDIDWVDIKKL